MSPEPVTVLPGDVLAIRTPSSPLSPPWWIRIGAALADKPDLSNHIAVVHHYDQHGTLWGIQGQPGGVGWVQVAPYLASKWLLTNAAQPKTTAQRQLVTVTMQALLGTGYDWEAIAADAADDLGFDWSPTWNGKVPGHVVCSSLACYSYDEAKLKRPPGNARTDQPADWDSFILDEAWA